MGRVATLWVGGLLVLGACVVDGRTPSIDEATVQGPSGGASGLEPGDSPSHPTDVGGAPGDVVGANDAIAEGVRGGGSPTDTVDAGQPFAAPGGPADAAPPPCMSPSCPEATPSDVTLSLLLSGDPGGRAGVTFLASDERVCTGPCSFELPPGTPVTVRAEPPLGGIVKRWSDARCGNEVICEVRVDRGTVLEVEFELGYNLAFVTSTTFTVPVLPRPGPEANQECARRAAAAGLPGTRWVAWLSGDGPTTALADDIDAIESFQSTGGWVRPDGVIVARSRTALGNGAVLHAVSVDDLGGRAPKSAWTGTGATGHLDRGLESVSNDCSSWTSVDPSSYGAIAVPGGVGANFAGPNVTACSRALGIICFGDDSNAEVPIVTPTPSRLAFLSTATFLPSTGIATADAICQREACAAGLTGSNDCALGLGAGRTFRSYLHTSTRPAWERFDLAGPTWVRPDGVTFLTQASALAADGAGHVSSLSVTLSLLYWSAARSVWIGDALGTSTCADWTPGGVQGRVGTYIYDSTQPLAAGTDIACTVDLPVFCLEG